MAYRDSKKLNRRTVADKVLRDKAFDIAKNTKYDGYQSSHASMVCKPFDKKKLLVKQLKTKLFLIKSCQKNYTNQLLENFIKVHSPFIGNIWCGDLIDMQLISKFDKGFRFVLCIIGVYIKYTWAIYLKDKKRITIINVFQKKLDRSKRKPNKIWVDQGHEFYNRLMKSFFLNNDTEMYLKHDRKICYY